MSFLYPKAFQHALICGLTLGVASAGLAACTPETDRTLLTDGNAPIPSGRIDGTVLYVGPRPFCARDDTGAVTRVLGKVVFLLFNADNPPAPEGTATSSQSLLLIPAREVFEETDCLPDNPEAADLAERLTRSAPFAWPDIRLARQGDHVDYQVRAFFDRDDDFIAFYSVTRLATRGDIVGGAFVDSSASPLHFTRIRFGSVDRRPNGEVIRGVSVTVGAPVNTELPAFERGPGTRALSAEAIIPPIPDPLQREQVLWQAAQMELDLIDPSNPSWASTLEAANISIDPDPSGYGFFTLPVDSDRDGAQDLHPTLGTAGINWEAPIVLMRRARNPVEVSAGIPDTLVIGTVRPSQTFAKSTFGPSVQIVVPPVAVVTLRGDLPQCRIPYVAPGNVAESYESAAAECQELPTGNYDINVLAGIAAGRSVEYRTRVRADNPGLSEAEITALVDARTDNGWIIEGGTASGQAWSIPNELGCPDPTYRPNARDADGQLTAISQVDADPFTTCGGTPVDCDHSGTNMQCSQGPGGRFAIVDPNPDNGPDINDNSDGHGIASCQTALRVSTLMPDSIEYMAIDPQCCEPIMHLCGLPLCPLRDDAVLADQGDNSGIRELRVPGEDFSVAEDGSVTALCVPFLMPAGCCRDAG